MNRELTISVDLQIAGITLVKQAELDLRYAAQQVSEDEMEIIEWEMVELRFADLEDGEEVTIDLEGDPYCRDTAKRQAHRAMCETVARNLSLTEQQIEAKIYRHFDDNY